MEARRFGRGRCRDQQAMSEANVQARVPGGWHTTEKRHKPIGVLGRTNTEQRGGCASQHRLQVTQHQHTDRGFCWIHPGQQSAD